MNDTVNPPLADELPASAPTFPRRLNIRFTGSGSEYFRIWAVNLLLIFITIGLYLPFAKARRIRYFYANTLVDGQALSFHGDTWKMFRGFILLVVLMAVYSGAGRFSPYAGVAAFIVLCAVWPALWRASMQFRLANTGWRGLRMHFAGTLKDAYLAVAPLYVPLVAFVTMSFEVQRSAGDTDADKAAQAALAIWIFAPMAVVALATPWFWALTKRYQHNGYRIANQHSRIALPTWRLYLLGLKGVLIGMVPAVLAGVALAGIVGALGASGVLGSASGKAWRFVIGIASGVLFYLFLFVLIGPYFASRIQNMVWGATRSESISFVSQLRFRSLFWLTLKNWTLVALTLSLYRPFAMVNTARLRLEAVSLNFYGSVEALVAQADAGNQDATGEIAGDFFGIDMGL